MRAHAAHVPHASPFGVGVRQFSDCATESAARCLPTPAGPANSRLGGSVPPVTERDSRSISRMWPTTSRKGIVGCYHALAALFLGGRLLRLRLRVTVSAEHTRPE